MKNAISIVSLRIAIVVLVVSGSMAATSSAGQVENFMNFQARLTDDHGDALDDGTYTLDFFIYDAATNGNIVGAILNVDVTLTGGNGIVSTPIGPVAESWFNDAPRFISLTIDDIDDDPTGDELLPRIRLTAVPFAMRAFNLPSTANIAIQTASVNDTISVDGSLQVGQHTAAPAAALVNIVNDSTSMMPLRVWRRFAGVDQGLTAAFEIEDVGITNSRVEIGTKIGSGNFWLLSAIYQDDVKFWVDSAGVTHARRLQIEGNGLVINGIGAPSEHAIMVSGISGSTSNWMGSGEPAQLTNLIGATDRHAGFGVVQGNNIASPIVWGYSGAENQNAFQVRAVGFGGNPIIHGVPVLVAKMNGNVGIGTENPQSALDVQGTVRTRVLTISGGSDLAEPFDIMSGEDVAIEPGMVMSIDPDEPGKLRPSIEAYDRKVAGIISGANGLNPGMVMRGEGDAYADGEHNIALTGRVWCWCDATAETGGGGAIEPGDMLTTSSTPGHAMKVADFDRANGAVIGKAMTRLEEGKGLVLVLVNLQ